MAIGTKFQITSITEFWKIAKEKETFFWHFCMDHTSKHIVLKPLSVEHEFINPLEVVVNQFGIDVYESYTKDSIDFLVELGVHTNQILNPKSRTFNPFFIGFKNGKKVLGTNIDRICYCLDGVVEIIAITDPDKFSQSLLGVEKENLE